MKAHPFLGVIGLIAAFFAVGILIGMLPLGPTPRAWLTVADLIAVLVVGRVLYIRDRSAAPARPDLS